jgi:7,8-dihydropterin-6-yl-methyl-4-(beta-D-ribofuranosyl)aminobenzene 5'-phosphate synthase
MVGIRNIGSVQQVSLTTLVDNKANLIVKSSDKVKYFTDEPLLAEHGFSVMIQCDDREGKILWDAGGSTVALIENMHRMKIDYTSITKIALSHGHLDHYAAMTALLHEIKALPEAKEWSKLVTKDVIEKWVEKHRIPIVAHPAAIRERWMVKDNGTMVGPFFPPPAQEWKSAGAKLIFSEKPYELSPGCWTTGFIPRTSFEASGRSKKMRYRKGSDFLSDDLEDDQAIVINVKDKGLIVLSGCAHSGIVNTINHAKQFTGIEKIFAVVGGYHLAHASDEELSQTISHIKNEKPKYVIPSHCTGFKAINRFAQEMPEEFIEGVVGTTYIF